MSEPLLLDTCACLWLTHGDPMSSASRRAVADAQRGAAGIHVSLIILDGVVCTADYNQYCPRGIYPYWREIWLRRIE